MNCQIIMRNGEEKDWFYMDLTDAELAVAKRIAAKSHEAAGDWYSIELEIIPSSESNFCPDLQFSRSSLQGMGTPGRTPLGGEGGTTRRMMIWENVNG
jgi:hypothetical protein